MPKDLRKTLSARDPVRRAAMENHEPLSEAEYREAIGRDRKLMEPEADLIMRPKT